MAYYVKYRKWWDTKHFQQAGKLFQEAKKNGTPSYCPFPRDSMAYKEFWDEQLYYIHNGYMHDGQRISNLHYVYLNYCPISLKRKKTEDFPDFYALDADYFLHLERFLGIGPWKDKEPFRPVTFSVAKTRQSGFSLKGAVPLIYKVQFSPYSVNYLGAWLEKDALKTLKMFHTYFEHQFRFTDFGKRWMSREKGKKYVTGYREEFENETMDAGYKSELNIVTFKDNAEKGVGGACDLFVIEESGLHPQVKTTAGFIEPACKDGDYTTGNILLYGAAGQTISREAEELHNNIEIYDGYAVDNVWDEPKYKMYKRTGYFVPNYSCRVGHMDEDGNPNPATAIVARDNAFKKTKEKDYIKYLLDVSQNPNTPREMFNSQARKRYDTNLIDQQIAFLQTHGDLIGYPVTLSRSLSTGKVHCSLGSEHEVINEYPLPTGRDKTGSVVIFEDPMDNPPANLYIASIDSYNQESTTGTSLGSIYIYKKTSNFGSEGTHRVIVAEYVGRPNSKHDFFNTCRYLLEYYNAIALPENEDQELTPWFITNNCEHLLADSPDIIRQYIPGSQVKRTKGIHADDKLIIPAENKIYRYLTEVIGFHYDEEGNKVGPKLGISRIPSLGLLRELREYSNDTWKNFDRVRTFGWVMMYEEETLNIEAQEQPEEEANWLVDTGRFGHSINQQFGRPHR